MRNTLLTIISFAVLTWSGNASSYMELAEEALELDTDQINLLAHDYGRIFVKLCDECNPLALKTSRSTEYWAGNKQVSRRDLVSMIRNTDSEILYVFYEPAELTVTRVMLEIFRQ